LNPFIFELRSHKIAHLQELSFCCVLIDVDPIWTWNYHVSIPHKTGRISGVFKPDYGEARSASDSALPLFACSHQTVKLQISRYDVRRTGLTITLFRLDLRESAGGFVSTIASEPLESPLLY
jgi:hypothetical protein